MQRYYKSENKKLKNILCLIMSITFILTSTLPIQAELDLNNEEKEYIEKNKKYPDTHKINFLGQDYTLPLDIEPVDLIISQYAGFVGQATKHYLKMNGILLCNDSHGDATLARFDESFEFIGIIDEKNRIQCNELERYFILPKQKTVNLQAVKETMKGPKYTLPAENYVFRKIK